MIVIIDSDDELAPVVVPADVQAAARELLAVGRPLLIAGEIDPVCRQLVATPRDAASDLPLKA
jgi:hypothetical protein